MKPAAKTITVSAERVIAASPAQVFDAWLNPKTPGTPWHEGDKPIFNPTVDGLFYWLISGTGHFGRFTKLDRPRRIQHTWMSKSTQGVESTLTVTFKKKGDDTLMSLQHSGLPSSAGGTSHNAGWKYFLDQLVDHFAVGARRQK